MLSELCIFTVCIWTSFNILWLRQNNFLSMKFSLWVSVSGEWNVLRIRSRSENSVLIKQWLIHARVKCNVQRSVVSGFHPILPQMSTVLRGQTMQHNTELINFHHKCPSISDIPDQMIFSVFEIHLYYRYKFVSFLEPLLLKWKPIAL